MNNIAGQIKTNDALEIQEKLRQIRDRFIKGLDERFSQIESLWQRYLVAGDQSDSDQSGEDQSDGGQPGENQLNLIKELHRLTHTLAGSGKTFGLAHMGQCASELEQIFKCWGEGKYKDTAQITTQIKDLLRSPEVGYINNKEYISTTSFVATRPTSAPEKAVYMIYFLDDDLEYATEMAIQLKHFDYEVRIFTHSQDIIDAVRDEPPDILLLDIMIADSEKSGIDVLNEIKRHQADDIPALFISSRTDFDARLEAVRAGSVGYLVKPFEVSQLVDRLDRVTHIDSHDPFRVLLVDDDVDLLATHTAALEALGMQVKAESDPRQVLERISEFMPDVMVFDVYMPYCNGIELSSLIRQHEEYIGIPIIFLSSEQDFDRQTGAMMTGADEFLVKPVSLNRFVKSVSYRAKRARSLLKHIVEDSLTGLYKHTKIKEILEIEVRRAARTREGMVFAMIDIDYFKKVNDTYGHIAGDRVIKNLSRMLKQRFRKSDSVGRYGGEEFAVVLTECTLEKAKKVFDELRQNFSEIVFTNADQTFSSTISIGLAAFPKYTSAADLNAAADSALYVAKDAGRNRVISV